MSVYFNEDTIVDLALIAKQEGWNQMVRDAYLFVEKDCEYKNTNDKYMLVKSLIYEVGDKLRDYAQDGN